MGKQKMNRGDHIYVQTPTFTHHGIYCGDGYVIHFDGHGKYLGTARIRKDTLEHFCSPFPVSEISVFEQCAPGLADEVMRKAESLLGKGEYHLLARNCEHFASYCITGRWESKQVSKQLDKLGEGAVDKLGEGSKQASRAVFRELARPTAFQMAQRAIAGQTNPLHIGIIYAVTLGVAGVARVIEGNIKEISEKSAPPGEVLEGSQKSIHSSEKSVTRLPQEPPKVEPKHKQEYINKQANEKSVTRLPQEPPKVEPKHKQEYINKQANGNN
jgi:hypothetical protein